MLTLISMATVISGVDLTLDDLSCKMSGWTSLESGCKLHVEQHADTYASGRLVKKTAVVLCGWFGAQQRHLSRYGTLFSRLGYNVCMVTAPTSVVFALTRRKARLFTLSLIRQLIEELNEGKGEEISFVFVFFSNGGAFIANELSALLHGETAGEELSTTDRRAVEVVKDGLAAVMFDCGPCYMHEEHGAKALAAGMPRMIPRAWVMTGHRMFDWIRKTMVCDMSKEFWEGMKHAQFSCVEMYVFSRSDELCDVEELVRLIRFRKERGHAVFWWMVEDAAHVQVMRLYKREYERVVEWLDAYAVKRSKDTIAQAVATHMPTVVAKL